MEVLIHEDKPTCGAIKIKDDFLDGVSIGRKYEENKMNRILRNGKNLIFLFVCGFFIGIFLEILLIERQKLSLVSQRDAVNSSVKVTCLVLQKHSHKRYIETSKKTWLKHCDEYFIVRVVKHQQNLENKIDNGTNALVFEEFEKLLNNNKTCLKEEGKFKEGGEIRGKTAWSGLCKALHMTKNGLKDWIIIVPDSLVVIVENLKLLVEDLNPDENHYYGYALENYSGDFNTLSAGILLSRGTVFKLLEKFKTESDCDLSGKYWKNEDLYLGKYLKELGILPKDTRDNEGRGRFHGYNLKNLLWPGKLFLQSNYIKKALYPVPKGFKCCSPFLVTLDVSDADAMRNLYYFLYKIRTSHEKPPKKIEIKKEKKFYWKDFLRDEGYNETAIENMTDEEYYKIWEKKFPLDTVFRETKNLLQNHEKLTESR